MPSLSLFEWITLVTALISIGVAIRKGYQAGGWRKALGVAIDQIESLEERNPSAGAALKKAIRTGATAAGIQDTLHAEVKRRTGGDAPTARPAAGVLLLLAAGAAASGCAAFGAPPKEETLGARIAVDQLAAAFDLADETWEHNLRAFAAKLEEAANAETDQAVLDDLRKLEMEGGLTQEAVREVYTWSAETKTRDAGDIRAALDKALNTRSRAELKEIWAKVRAYWTARLDADALRAESEAELRRLLERAKIPLPDALFAPRTVPKKPGAVEP